MENNYKICKNCNAQNTASANFCETCGAKLEYADASNQTQSAQNPNEQVFTMPYYESQQAPQPQNTYFDTEGVSEAEFAEYIGKNQDKFIPQFRNFCNGKKASFSPLVFLLSWLVTPLAGAFWFFHRKMNKLGAIFLSIALVLTAASGVVFSLMANDIIDSLSDFISSGVIVENQPQSYYDDDYFSDYGYDNYDDYEYSDEATEKYVTEVFSSISKYGAFSNLLQLLNLGYALLLGIFAKYLYFKDSANKILAIKKKNPTPSSINDIAMAGGTNCVIWVICLVVYIIAVFGFTCGLIFDMASKLIGSVI